MRRYEVLLGAAVLLLMAISSGVADGLTISAASAARADVQAAVDAAADGDLVQVPAGTATWSSAVQIGSAITLRGAGRDLTVITNARDDTTPRASPFEALVEVQASRDAPFRITGFTFRSTSIDLSSDHIIIRGSSRGFRIDNNRFATGGFYSIRIRGDIYGVIDHNEFADSSREAIIIQDAGDGYDSFSRPLPLGTDQAVYVEDNSFQFVTKGDHAISGILGARYVFRYNAVSSAAGLNASQIDVHGNFFTVPGSRSFEIYGNELASGASYQGMYIRGATGVIFGNTMTGAYTHPMIFANYRSFDTPSGETPGACGYSACSFPAPDQIQDTHVWSNTYNGVTTVPYVRDRGLEREHLQVDQAYFLSPRPGYAPYIYPHPVAIAEGGAGDPAAGVPPAPPANLRLDTN